MDPEWPRREQIFEPRQKHFKKNHECTPVNVLVPDVLREIFTHAMLAEDEDFTLETWNRIAPNNVSAVCRRWRTIAIKSPRLWSAFRIFGPYSSDPQILVTALNNFLSRAGQALLDIRIDSIFEGSALRMEVSKHLVSRQSQFRKVDLCFSYPDWISIHPPVLTDLSAVEDLRLWYLGDDSTAHLHLSNMLKLRLLYLTGRFSLHLPSEPILRNLVHVEFAAPYGGCSNDSDAFLNAQDCLAVLESCPSIEFFSATSIVHVGSEVVFRSRTTKLTFLDLPNLSTLQLIDVGPPVAQCILGKLRVSGLKDLVLTYTEPCRQGCGLSPLLLRSEPGLLSFAFDGLHISDIVACLESSPDLRRLFICDCSEGLWELDELLDRLTFTTDARLCPRLEHIGFEDVRDGLGLTGIEAVIISRWECLPPGEERSLETVTFDRCVEITSSSFGFVSWPWLKKGPKITIIINDEQLQYDPMCTVRESEAI